MTSEYFHFQVQLLLASKVELMLQSDMEATRQPRDQMT